jgi:hypothetical protein
MNNNINNIGGFNDGLLYDDEYDKETSDIECPENNPYLCTIDTKSFGLCKKNKSECNQIDVLGIQPIIKSTLSDAGKAFGYSSQNLHTRCENITLANEYNMPGTRS